MPFSQKAFHDPNEEALQTAYIQFPSKHGGEVLSGQIKALKMIILLGADEARRQTPINDTDICTLKMAGQPLKQKMFEWGWQQVMDDLEHFENS